MVYITFLHDVFCHRKQVCMCSCGFFFQINLALDVEINLPRKIQKLLKLNPTSFDIPLMEPSNGLTKLYTSSVNVIDGELLSVKNISERAKIVVSI